VLRLNAYYATPSPLNGERAGVRGVTDFGVPLARRALFSIEGPSGEVRSER
jgi:hypothetical protein